MRIKDKLISFKNKKEKLYINNNINDTSKTKYNEINNIFNENLEEINTNKKNNEEQKKYKKKQLKLNKFIKNELLSPLSKNIKK